MYNKDFDFYLFTGVNYNLYQPPGGFDFEMGSNDEPIMVGYILCFVWKMQHVSHVIGTCSYSLYP